MTDQQRRRGTYVVSRTAKVNAGLEAAAAHLASEGHGHRVDRDPMPHGASCEGCKAFATVAKAWDAHHGLGLTDPERAASSASRALESDAHAQLNRENRA